MNSSEMYAIAGNERDQNGTMGLVPKNYFEIANPNECKHLFVEMRNL